VSGMNNLEKVSLFSRRLLEWWFFHGKCFPWRYDILLKKDPWKVMSIGVLLWKTRAENVAKIYIEFFRKYPSCREYLFSDRVELLHLLKKTGLQNRKKHLLDKIATFLCGEDFSCSALKRLKLGQYILNNTEMILCDEKIIPIDSPVLRVLERALGFKVKNVRKISVQEKEFLQVLLKDESPVLVYWALVDFANLICLPHKPDCSHCFFENECLYKRGVLLNQEK